MRTNDTWPPETIRFGNIELAPKTFVVTPLGATKSAVDPARYGTLLMERPRTAFVSFGSVERFLREEGSSGEIFVAGAISFDSSGLRYARIAPVADMALVDAALAERTDVDGAIFAAAYGDQVRLRPTPRLAIACREIRAHRLTPGRVGALPRRVLVDPQIRARMEAIKRALKVSATEAELEAIATDYPRGAARSEFYYRALQGIRGERYPEPKPAEFVWGDPFSQAGGYFGWGPGIPGRRAA